MRLSQGFFIRKVCSVLFSLENLEANDLLVGKIKENIGSREHKNFSLVGENANVRANLYKGNSFAGTSCPPPQPYWEGLRDMGSDIYI